MILYVVPIHYVCATCGVMASLDPSCDRFAVFVKDRRPRRLAGRWGGMDLAWRDDSWTPGTLQAFFTGLLTIEGLTEGGVASCQT